MTSKKAAAGRYVVLFPVTGRGGERLGRGERIQAGDTAVDIKELLRRGAVRKETGKEPGNGTV